MTNEYPLDRLMQWYRARCDGKWEHQYGVKIETLDNPGWRLTIDLSETELIDRPFESVEHAMDDERAWSRCWRDPTHFNAACGPEKLTGEIETFVDWTLRRLA